MGAIRKIGNGGNDENFWQLGLIVETRETLKAACIANTRTLVVVYFLRWAIR